MALNYDSKNQQGKPRITFLKAVLIVLIVFLSVRLIKDVADTWRTDLAAQFKAVE